MNETPAPAATPLRPVRVKPEKAKDGSLDFTKAFGDIRMPGLDLQALAASQHKNLEALAQAGQLAVDGVRAVAQRQAQIVQQAFEQASTMFRELAQPGAPEDRVAKHAELAKSAFETGVANARELRELVAKTGNDTFEVIRKRVTESLDEVRKLVSR